jgi:WD40 repeat protein
VSAIAVDPTGSRVLTGGYDYVVRMYDFQGMDSRLRSFRQVEPSEGHQIRALSWSPTADQFLAVTGSAQAKIYDRDGFTLGEFVKGDMYIRDLKNTKGHISGLTGGHWHPKDRETALTSSEDGSLRIWDVTNFKTQKQVSTISKDSEQSFIMNIPKVDSGFMGIFLICSSFIYFVDLGF